MSKIKDTLRKKYKAVRSKITDNDNCENLFLSHNLYISSEVILVYASFNFEQSTRELISKALYDKKSVFLPRIKSGEMKFYRIYSPDDLKPGFFGIDEPAGSELYSGCDCVCIVPGIAFDKKGYRLGYGGGYYDKFLSTRDNIIKVGFCSKDCFADELPIESTDIKMDYIFYEDIIYRV